MLKKKEDARKLTPNTAIRQILADPNSVSSDAPKNTLFGNLIHQIQNMF